MKTLSVEKITEINGGLDCDGAIELHENWPSLLNAILVIYYCW